jgi:hypothetical protein
VGSATAPADHEVSICVGCGLCCDGTVLSHIAVRDDSDLGLPLKALGVTVIVEADPPVFALPCPAVHDGVCTIYDRHRPRACAWFECDLSSAVLAGEVPLDEARAVVAATVSVRDRVRAGEADAGELRSLVERHFRRP